MQKSGGIRAGFQGLEGGVVPVKIKALASLRSSDYRWIAGIADISMLEVGFGPSNKAHKDQVKIAHSIYHSNDIIPIDNKELFIREANNIADPKRAKFSYNPNHHEWLASRTHLIRLMETRGILPKRSRELSNDALIYMCAWNSRSSIITNNIKDFEAFNESSKIKNPKHLIPIYSIHDLELSLTNDISFPENIIGNL